MKRVLRAWGQLERGFELLPLGQMCFWGHEGSRERGFEVLALGEICFQGMEAVEKGVSGVGTW